MSSILALLVIDVQTGAFDGQRCPPIAEADRLLSTTQGLIAAARAASAPVIHVQHGENVAGEVFEEGSAQWHIHPSVAPAAGELVVRKRESSAFAGTALEAELRQRGITTLAVCGLQSEHCVTNTTLAALERGFGVLLAHDGHSTWPGASQTAPQIIQQQNELLAARGAQPLACRDIELRFAAIAAEA